MAEDKPVKGKALYWAEVLSTLAAFGYYVYLIYGSEVTVVPFKAKVLHHTSRLLEKISAAAWTGALAMRREYRRDVES